MSKVFFMLVAVFVFSSTVYAEENDYTGPEEYEGDTAYDDAYEDYENDTAHDDYEDNHEPEELEIMSLAEALHANYSQFYTEDEITFVPLRRVAEAMGFIVLWNSYDRSVPIYHADGRVFTIAFIGRLPLSAEAAPIIREGRTYVPISFFDILTGM